MVRIELLELCLLEEFIYLLFIDRRLGCLFLD